MASQGGFAKTMWCGELACELKMKEEAGMTSRCIPFAQEHLGDTCPCLLYTSLKQRRTPP